METKEQMTMEHLMAQIEALKAANALLEAKANRPKGSIKVSPKGAISVYGLGKFPVTLYASQWEALFTKQDEIKAFITENLSKLATKE